MPENEDSSLPDVGVVTVPLLPAPDDTPDAALQLPLSGAVAHLDGPPDADAGPPTIHLTERTAHYGGTPVTCIVGTLHPPAAHAVPLQSRAPDSGYALPLPPAYTDDGLLAGAAVNDTVDCRFDFDVGEIRIYRSDEFREFVAPVIR